MIDDDEAESRRVVVLGVESRDQLFPGKPAIGETLTMSGVPYTVIGVLEKKKQNGSYGSGPDNTQLFVPYSSMARDFPPPEKPGVFKGWINNLVVEVVDPNQHEAAISRYTKSSDASTISNRTTKTLSSYGIRSTAPNWWNTSSAS